SRHQNAGDSRIAESVEKSPRACVAGEGDVDHAKQILRTDRFGDALHRRPYRARRTLVAIGEIAQFRKQLVCASPDLASLGEVASQRCESAACGFEPIAKLADVELASGGALKRRMEALEPCHLGLGLLERAKRLVSRSLGQACFKVIA